VKKEGVILDFLGRWGGGGVKNENYPKRAKKRFKPGKRGGSHRVGKPYKKWLH